MNPTNKITVSPEWTPAERASLIKLLNCELDEEKADETKMRKTLFWEAPCLVENKNRQLAISQLIGIAGRATAKFLERNRGNFSAYIK